MCAAFGDEPGKNLEILIGQMVNLLRDGQPLRMSKRAGTVDHARRPRRGDRRRRRALRAGPLHLRLQHRHRPRPVGQGRPTTTRSTTCSTPTPGLPRSCATPPTSGWRPPGDDALRPGAARPREGGRAAARARRVPAGGRQPPPSCASRTGWRATSRTPPARSTGSTTPAGCCRWATRSRPTDPPRPAAAGRGHPHRARQRPAPARGLRPGADVAHARPRGRLGRTPTAAPADPPGCGSPPTSTRSSPLLWSPTAARRPTACSGRGSAT